MADNDTITRHPSDAVDASNATPGDRNLDNILRIPVSVQVVLGSTTMPVANLIKLGRGAVIPLDQRVGEPVAVVVNGRIVARGEVVVVEDDNSRFGVSLTEIVGTTGAEIGKLNENGIGAAMNTMHDGATTWIATGPKKAAALLLAMGKPLAGRLLKHFDANELREVTRSAAELGSVTAVALESVIEEFAGQFPTGLELLGSAGEAEELLNGVLTPEQVADIMSDVTGVSNSAIWEKLSALADSMLANYLAKEHPQTVALVLGKVTPACAAKVMGFMPKAMRNEVLRRMLVVKPVMEPAMRIIERSLHEDLLVNVARKSDADTNSRMADIINKMERDQIEEVLQSLAEARPKAAETLKSLLFTFDDIINLSAQARLILLDQIPTERVVLALKGTDTAFRESILSSMAARARRMVEHELANGGPASQREVMKARRAIADLALEMADKGQLELNASEEEDAVIE